MRIHVRMPAGPGLTFDQIAADNMVGARLYVPDGRQRREIGFVVSATRYNRGTVVVLEVELHNERDRLIAEMRAFDIGVP